LESWLELYELISEWSFLPVALALVLVATVGTGMVRNRLPRALFLVLLGLMGAALYLGLNRHEWGEVLFNGQLL